MVLGLFVNSHQRLRHTVWFWSSTNKAFACASCRSRSPKLSQSACAPNYWLLEPNFRITLFDQGCWSFGLVIGPAFGGLLAQPATHYPTVFSESGLFGRFVDEVVSFVGLNTLCCETVFVRKVLFEATSLRETPRYS